MKVFIDYYEVLEISPNANADTIDRIFRYLAQRYHPDNQQTGNHQKFSELVQAHEILRNPEKRAQYDLDHKRQNDNSIKLVQETNDVESLELDSAIRERVLSVMYIKRKRNIQNPGISLLELERLTGCPHEHLEFHLWYLKEKGWISRMENGLLAITADGVDQAVNGLNRISTKLLTDQQTITSYA